MLKDMDIYITLYIYYIIYIIFFNFHFILLCCLSYRRTPILVGWEIPRSSPASLQKTLSIPPLSFGLTQYNHFCWKKYLGCPQSSQVKQGWWSWVLGSVEIGENSKFWNGYCFYIALGSEDQDGTFFLGLVSHLAGWNVIWKFYPPIEKWKCHDIQT